MTQISIVKADANSLTGAKLNQMALGNVAYTLAGTKEETIIDQTFSKASYGNRITIDSATNMLTRPRWAISLWG